MAELPTSPSTPRALTPWLARVEEWLLAKSEFRMVPDLVIPLSFRGVRAIPAEGRRVAFVGFPSDYSLLILLGLLRSEVQLVGLATSLGANPAIAGENALSQVAGHLEVPLVRLARVNEYDSLALLRRLGADLFIVASFDQILHRRALEIPSMGWVNVHPSLLPSYRGPEPVYWALANGEPESGVSFQRVAAGIDAGPLLFQAQETVLPRDTAGTLTRRLTELAWRHVPQVVDEALRGAPGKPMDLSKGSYFTSVGHRRIDGLDSVITADRMVRAGDPNMLAAAFHEGRVAYVRRAIPVAADDVRPGPRLHYPDGDLLLLELAESCGCHHAEPVGSCPHDETT
jgi:methionyl-tRNA formyltransferase